MIDEQSNAGALQQPDLQTMLDDLVHLALVAEASCSNHEVGAHAALSAYGQKHREILALFAEAQPTPHRP